jgi:hypothetical protein
MNIYVLKRKNGTGTENTAGIVLQSQDIESARLLAANSDKMNNTPWLNYSMTTCELIGTANTNYEEIILMDVNYL